jgi:hypothetical protein
VRRVTRRERAALALGLAAACAVVLALGTRRLDVPGLYYDEVIQAEPALQYLAADGRPSEVPGVRSARLLGGWFPVMTQTYMGALKSQLLIPVFAIAEPTAATLRIATLCAALLGLAATLWWARLALGVPEAVLAALLLACDPSFLFAARHDWGSFAIGFACRAGGLACTTSAWLRGSRARALAGGLLLGLGLYNKIDFAVFLAAAALALAAAFRGELARVRRRPALLLFGGAGFACGAAPMLAALGGALGAARYVLREPGTSGFEWGEKLRAAAAVLDGSYFERLMRAGGSFEQMFAQPVAPGPFGALFACAAAWLALRLARRRPLAGADRARAFCISVALATLGGILLTPRGERIHHFLNAWPFPQLVAASAAVELWRGAGGARTARRALCVAAVAAALGAGLARDARTLAWLGETGGRGRWSDALGAFGAELARREPDAVLVSLDWGFDGPLRFAARPLEHVEPIWALQRPPRPDAVWRFSGTASHVYLVYEPPYAVFPYGAALLEALRALPPEIVEIRRHLDRGGEPAFVSARIARPHELFYRRGFEVKLR